MVLYRTPLITVFQTWSKILKSSFLVYIYILDEKKKWCKNTIKSQQPKFFHDYRCQSTYIDQQIGAIWRRNWCSSFQKFALYFELVFNLSLNDEKFQFENQRSFKRNVVFYLGEGEVWRKHCVIFNNVNKSFHASHPHLNFMFHHMYYAWGVSI